MSNRVWVQCICTIEGSLLFNNLLQLPAACFNKETESSPIVEVTIPAFIGPDQGKPWVGVLRELSEVGYYWSVKKIFKKVVSDVLS